MGISLATKLKREFARNRRGNVAMMWALMGAVLIGLIGITVDFTRAQMLRTQMQNAVDGAVLVAERSSGRSLAERTAAARAFFDAEMGADGVNVTFVVRELTDGGHRVDATMPMAMGLARIVSEDPWNLHVDAEAQADARPARSTFSAPTTRRNCRRRFRRSAQALANCD